MRPVLWLLCLLLLAAGYIAAPTGPLLAAGLTVLLLPAASDSGGRCWAPDPEVIPDG